MMVHRDLLLLGRGPPCLFILPVQHQLLQRQLLLQQLMFGASQLLLLLLLLLLLQWLVLLLHFPRSLWIAEASSAHNADSAVYVLQQVAANSK